MFRKTFYSVILLIVIGCGGQHPPELCSPLDDQEIFIGKPKTVTLCFTDADGQELMISVTSSDPSVVTAEGSAGALRLEAASVGQAVVTVRATDPDNQMVETTVHVTVPNRSPEVSDLPSLITLSSEDSTLVLILTDYFIDPDGHVLLFNVNTIDRGVIGVSVVADTLMILRQGIGTTQISITAEDAYDGSITKLLPVSTFGFSEIFRDDFDSLVTKWRLDPDTEVSITEGRVRVSSFNANAHGLMERRIEPIRNWRISVNLENETRDVWGGLLLRTGSTVIPYIVFLFGREVQEVIENNENPDESSNFMFGAVIGSAVYTAPVWRGKFDAITEAGVPMDIQVSAVGNIYFIHLNGEVVVTIRSVAVLPSELPSTIQEIGLWGWTRRNAPLNGGVLYDWIEVEGDNSLITADIGYLDSPIPVRWEAIR